jgi:hypothetical protein
MRTMRLHPIAGFALALALAACGAEPARTSSERLPAAVVDSAVPAELALQRFRARLGAPPAELGGGRSSREGLVAAVVTALAQRDTAAFEPVALNRLEFAYLYFPDSPTARPPYELPPALAWSRIQETNRRNVLRSLDDFGGRDWRVVTHACAREPLAQGANRIWTDCRVTMHAGTDTVEVPLIGGIVERDSVFKILTYASDR